MFKRVIARFARRCTANFIAIGTRGGRGVERAFPGTVAESVLRIDPVPVPLARGR